MGIKEYKKAIDRTGLAHLTLCNQKGESVLIGTADKVTHLASDKLRFVWKVKKAQDWYKYDRAVFHVNNKVYFALELDTPFSPETGKIEFVYDL